jgi:hypothetical protein
MAFTVLNEICPDQAMPELIDRGHRALGEHRAVGAASIFRSEPVLCRFNALGLSAVTDETKLDQSARNNESDR